MPAHEIEDVIFLGNTKIFKERKQMAFLLLLRPTYMQKYSFFKSCRTIFDFCGHSLLICGLFCTPEKPHLKVFQDTLVNKIENLQHFEVQIEVNKTKISIEKICLHGHLADLVAKAISLCFSQFNGKSGCYISLHPGQMVQQCKGTICIYPYTNKEPPGRTQNQTLLHAEMTERTRKAVFGVKGRSPLLRALHVPQQLLLDYMHLVLAGEFLRRLNI